MIDTSISIAASRFGAALDIARLGVNNAAKCQYMDEFALTGEGKLLFHGLEITGDVLWTIPEEDKRAVLESIMDAAQMWIDDLNCEDEGEEAA
ncbi:hypothetical protein EV663_11654 [Rhodovulum bhavnagarense]|uniref:Uncharacterized protein n=1 Tax=Rhodovulum bhavnagarense TaxID=992286 RepID=A0A4R2RC02_9RHOB|nr:hypothetical protein [Rhodovulum bhavnagarense]TCP59758.1 hypothetical protein EV663_11654 [Rhodovulum bhavnagarense]